jgi:hypothetical protein
VEELHRELELFCQQQITRLKSPKSGHVGISATSPDATADPVKAHAAGPRKPSLSELERDGEMWTPSIGTRKRF